MQTKILVPIDLDEVGFWEKALAEATDIAKHKDAQVHLLTIIHATPAVVSQFLPGGYEQKLADKIQGELDEVAAKLSLDKDNITTSVRYGGVYQEILAYAEKIGADLIVIGSHQPDVTDYLIGSNAARVVRHAHCSVLVVR